MPWITDEDGQQIFDFWSDEENINKKTMLKRNVEYSESRYFDIEPPMLCNPEENLFFRFDIVGEKKMIIKNLYGLPTLIKMEFPLQKHELPLKRIRIIFEY